MKRLKDEIASELERAAALRLLRTGRPLSPSNMMRRRVRLALTSAAARRPKRMLLRPAMAASLVVALLGLASAMTRLRLPGARTDRTASRSTAVPADSLATAPTLPSPKPVPAVVPSARLTPAPQERADRSAAGALLRPTKPAAERRPSKLPERRDTTSAPSTAPPSDLDAARASGSGPSATASAPSVPTPDTASIADEVELYVEGLKALRQTRDFRRAAALLQVYRRFYPKGAFVEESWALSIEAAAALGQNPREEAEDYLSRFPRGRFRALAKQALSR